MNILERRPETQFVERLASVEDFAAQGDHLARYRFALQWAGQCRVMDLCCGVGAGTFLLAAAGARCVRGLDISEDAVDAARRLPKLPNLAFELRDVCAGLPEAGTWNLITCFEGIEHVPSPELLLHHIYKSLKPGGLAVISTPNADAFGAKPINPFHVSPMTEAQFRKAMSGQAWKIQWYAQIGGWIWSRPQWQQALISTAARWKAGNWNGLGAGLSQESDDGCRTVLDVDTGYPIPYRRAISVSKTPPAVLVAVCQRSI